MGSTDMAAIMAYGEAWLKVPRSCRIEVDGNLGAQVYSKDVFLHLRGRIAARVLAGAGRRLRATRLVLCNPASRSVLLQAISEGVIATLVEAGAAVCAPGCGFCIGRTVALGDGGRSCLRRTGTSRAGWGIIIQRFISRRSRLPL